MTGLTDITPHRFDILMAMNIMMVSSGMYCHAVW